MKSLQISFILLFSFLLISDESEPLYGKGLPRDSDQLIPSESSYPSWETGEYESINPQRMKDVVIDISNIALESKKRTPYWGRLPGTPEDKKTMDYIESKLTKLGFSIEKKDVYITKEWRPTEWSLSYKFDNKSRSIKSAFPTGENINHIDSNINAELVWVGLGSEADFLNKDIKGKAVVIYSFFVPGGRSHSASNRAKLFNANEIASDKGAALIINIMGVPGDGQFAGGAFHGTSGKPASSFKAPIITISQDEGFLLRDRMLKEKIFVEFNLKINVIENLKTTYMIARLDGTSDEEIFIGAHTDGYFEGAMDNALGKKVLKDGKIYDPGRGRVFKSNLYLLDDGTLKVEGCFMGICDHEIWQPLVVTINEDGTRTAEPFK